MTSLFSLSGNTEVKMSTFQRQRELEREGDTLRILSTYYIFPQSAVKLSAVRTALIFVSLHPQ